MKSLEITNLPLDLTGLDPFYQKEFQLIHESNGQYKGKWNWMAFFFTGFWCLSKGCWVLGIITLLTLSLFSFKFELAGVLLNFSISALCWAVVLGWRGTWIYYNVKVLKIQIP